MKKLFELNNFPWITIETTGEKLKIRFDAGYSSYADIHEIIVKYDKKENHYVLLERRKNGKED